jgi:hypothetical protein
MEGSGFGPWHAYLDKNLTKKVWNRLVCFQICNNEIPTRSKSDQNKFGTDQSVSRFATMKFPLDPNLTKISLEQTSLSPDLQQ